MPNAPMPRRSMLLCSTLDNPRRIELRKAEILDAYGQRGTADDIIEVGHELTKLRRTDISKMLEALNVFQCLFSALLNRPRRRPSSGWGSRRFAGWKKDDWRKEATGVSLVPAEKRPRTKDDDEKDWDRTLNRYAYVFSALGAEPRGRGRR